MIFPGCECYHYKKLLEPPKNPVNLGVFPWSVKRWLKNGKEYRVLVFLSADQFYT